MTPRDREGPGPIALVLVLMAFYVLMASMGFVGWDVVTRPLRPWRTCDFNVDLDGEQWRVEGCWEDVSDG